LRAADGLAESAPGDREHHLRHGHILVRHQKRRVHRIAAMLTTIVAALAVAASVPNVTAGPDAVVEADPLAAPIDSVTVFSDRARVRRKAQANLRSGVSTWRLPDLPGATMLDSVRVSSSRGRVLRVEARPIQRDRTSIPKIETLLDALEKVQLEIAHLDAKIAAEQGEASALASWRPAPVVPESQREGRAPPPIDVPTWLRVSDFVGERREARVEAQRELAEQRKKLDQERMRLMRELQSMDLGGISSRVIGVVVIVEAARARPANIELEYFIPGATWTPIYDLELDAKTNKLTMKTAGLVQQASGEDWSDVALELSTAIPGQGIHFPELLTWTLGEKREFIPRARPARQPPRPPAMPGPSPRVSPAEVERQARLAQLQQRLQVAMGNMRSVPAETSRRSRPRKKSRPRSRAPSARPPPAPAQSYAGSVEVDVSSDDMDGEVTIAESTSRSSGPRYKRRSLALREPLLARDRHLRNANVPARLAGGFDYVYPSRTRVSVPSAGAAHRVPLSVRTFEAVTQYAATPSLAKTAYMRAEVVNDASQPILRGPVNIFVGGDFTGEGQLQTTGTGGKIRLPLGADEDVRLIREVVPATRTEGVFSKDDITSYAVKLEVGNYKRRAIEIEVTDQIPKTRNGKIAVKLGSVSPAAIGPPNADGLLKWRVTIAPGKTAVIRFEYTITRPADWQLQQR